MSRCSNQGLVGVVLAVLAVACGGAEPQGPGDWTAAEWTGPGTGFAGHAAVEAAGSAAPEPTKPAPKPEPQPEAGAPAQPVTDPVPEPVATAGSPAPAMGGAGGASGSAAGSGAAGTPAMGAAGSAPPLARVEVVLCTVALHGVAPKDPGVNGRLTAGLYTPAGASFASATAYEKPLSSQVPVAVFVAENLTAPDAVMDGALRAEQQLEIVLGLRNPDDAAVTLHISKTAACAISAGDVITGHYVKATINRLQIDGLGEVRGYKAQ